MKQKSAKRARTRNNIIVHTVLAVLAVIWLFPVMWVVLTSPTPGQTTPESMCPSSLTQKEWNRAVISGKEIRLPWSAPPWRIISAWICRREQSELRYWAV